MLRGIGTQGPSEHRPGTGTSNDQVIIHKPPKYIPDILILINGKRKSGKDFLTEKLIQRFGEDRTSVLRIAAPIKHYWAVKNQLDYNKLLDASVYKEEHRLKMIEWSQEVRKANYGYFNVEAIKMANAIGKPIWICSDIRHRPDYDWFMEFYKQCIRTVHVKASENTRKARGWIFTQGVDDGPSECGLDDVTEWDLTIVNDGDEALVESGIKKILSWIPVSNSTKN